MRSVIALPALIAVAAAQIQSFSFATRSSTTDNEEPTATETISGPIETGKACGQIADLVTQTSFDSPSVEADLAYACLKSVPIDTDAASDTVTALKQMLEFQSTLSYLKSPPKGYSNGAVDLMSGLDGIAKNITDGKYDNEFDFETDISALLVKAHDGHLSFGGMAYGGAFRWRRNRQVALISASKDGSETPKIWAIHDFNHTGGAGFTPSAVTQIDGKDVTQFLQDESALNAYHDPDTRYNALFYMQPAENYGYFTNPRFYPGAKVNLTFENGTSNEYNNLAIVQDPGYWSYISDGKSFYETFVSPSSNSNKIKKRSPHQLPRHLENPREAELDRRYVPENYPSPLVEHSSPDVVLAGFSINNGGSKVGVLMVQTFNTESNADAREFQSVVQEYISKAKSESITKHIIDIRSNGGGKVLLGYDMYLQFFPTQKPQVLSRYRGHQGSDLIGSSVSTLDTITALNGDLYTSPFNYHSYLDKDLKDFDSWKDMYPPDQFNGDNFTNLLRYNLSDPLTTTSNRFSIGVEMTGYGDRSNFTEDPFKADDIIMLSDGICASTCSLFVELMVQQSGVRTLAVGGRPHTGPMQAVGGTKGSLVLQSDYLTAVSEYVISDFANSRSEMNDWMKILPIPFSIAVSDASVNFQDNIRKGLEKDGIPTQFLNDTASCRIWYEPDMYLNVTSLWNKAADVAFGSNGALDEKACVSGSVTSKESQQGQGSGNPTTGNGDTSSPSPSKSKGAAPGAIRPPQGGWTAILVCSAIVLSSMVFGATLI